MTIDRTNLPQQPEDEAFARFRIDGDADALADVYDALAPGLLRLAMKLLGDAAAAEDVLQATFVSAIESSARHDGQRPVRAWLSGILANHVRHHRRREARPLDVARLPSPRPAEDPLHAAEAADLERALQRHVRELPEDWHAPILMRVREGLTASEIAERLERPAGTIRSQLARGLERLRTGLASALAVLAWRAPRGRATTASKLTLLGGLVIIPSLLLVVALSTPTSTEPAPTNAAVLEPSLVAEPQTRPTLASEPAPRATRLTPRPSPVSLLASAAFAPLSAEPADETPDPLGPLDVVVLGVAGGPVDGALVEVWSERAAYDHGKPPARSRTTDANGSCQVTLSGHEVVAARGDAAMSVAIGRLDAHVLQRWDAGSRVPLELRLPCRVTGVVVGPDGQPRPAAQIRLSRAGGTSRRGQGRQPPPLVLDEQGRFEIELTAGTFWRFTPSFAERRGPSWQVNAKPGAEHELRLSIPGDWRLHGVVQDATGAAVPGAQVWSWPMRPTSEISDAIVTVEIESGGRSTRSDEQGRYDLSFDSTGTWLVQARADGHPPGDVLEVEVTPQRPAVPLTLRLPRAASISGRVVDSAGEPVSDVSVQATEPGWPTPRTEPPGPSHTDRYGKTRTTTDADGAFVLGGLHPDGVFELRAAHESLTGFAPRLTRDDVRAGSADIVLVLADAPAARFHGRVLEADGVTPVPHFEIIVSRRTDNGWMRLDHEFRDDLGHFSLDELDPTLPLAFRIHALEPENEFFELLGVEVPVRRSDLAPLDIEWSTVPLDAEPVTLRLQHPGRLEVTALDEHGAALAYVEVHVARDQEARHATYRRPLRSDEHGLVTFEGLMPGRHRVSAPGCAAQVVDVIGGQLATVTLRPE